MPQKPDECLADERFLSLSGYKVGDTISVKSGTDEDIADTLAVTEYKIVGSGTTAYYLSLDLSLIHIFCIFAYCLETVQRLQCEGA